jgi:hypothetical protein
VAQEFEPEALALAGTLDQAGDVGHGVPHLAGVDDAEVGVQGRERVVGDLGARGGHGRDQAGLAGRRVADEGDIRDGLEFKLDIAFPPVGAEKGEAGGLALGGSEGGVAEPALSAGGDDDPEPRFGHVGQFVAFGVLHHGAKRHRQLENLAGEAGAVVAHPGAAVG